MGEVEKYLVYPEMAIRVGIAGTVNIISDVKEQGGVFKTEVDESLELGRAEAAIEAI